MAGFARGAPVFGLGPPFSAVRALAARALAQPRPPLALWAAGGLGRARALRWVTAGGVPPPAGGGCALGPCAFGAQPSHGGARFARGGCSEGNTAHQSGKWCND